MKTRITLSLTLLALCCGLASAQVIHVRVGSQTNLRDDHSLEGDIVDTVPAGTILRVINWEDHWLRVMHGDERAWMADWVNYALLRTGADADATTPLSQTENCCVLEWQCPDEDARASGYWAYRFGQCHIAETYLTEDFSVYNCCFLGERCLRDQNWRDGYISFQNSQCEVRSVQIDGSIEFKLRMQKAFAMLKDRAPVWYAFAISGLDRIREVSDFMPAGAHVHERRFDEVVREVFVDAPGDAPIVWVAGVLVHEACHVHVHEAGLFTVWGSRPEEEKACTEVQLIASDIIDPTDYYNDYLQTLIDNIHDPEYQWW